MLAIADDKYIEPLEEIIAAICDEFTWVVPAHKHSEIDLFSAETASHTLTAFSKEIYRDIKIYGTSAELVGVMEDNAYEIRYFDGRVEKVQVDISAADVGGHNECGWLRRHDGKKILGGRDAENRFARA